MMLFIGLGILYLLIAGVVAELVIKPDGHDPMNAAWAGLCWPVILGILILISPALLVALIAKLVRWAVGR